MELQRESQIQDWQTSLRFDEENSGILTAPTLDKNACSVLGQGGGPVTLEEPCSLKTVAGTSNTEIWPSKGFGMELSKAFFSLDLEDFEPKYRVQPRVKTKSITEQ